MWNFLSRKKIVLLNLDIYTRASLCGKIYAFRMFRQSRDICPHAKPVQWTALWGSSIIGHRWMKFSLFEINGAWTDPGHSVSFVCELLLAFLNIYLTTHETANKFYRRSLPKRRLDLTRKKELNKMKKEPRCREEKKEIK